MLSLDDFQPVTLDDKKVFDEIKKDFPPVHSDNVFTTIISWMDYANYHYNWIDENLLLYSNIKNQIRFRPPRGKRNKKLFEQVIKLSGQQDSDAPLGVIDFETKKWMENNFPKLVFNQHPSFSDYVYLSSDLANLEGSKYSKIRNRLNKFKKSFSYNIEPINDKNMAEVRQFLKRWCLWRDCESDPLLDHERKAILFSMDNFFELELSGLAMILNNRIEAISVYEQMSPDTIVVHYEKGSPDYDGIYKVINQETANIVQKQFKYINRESDMGIPGLRKAKQSYRPHHMIDVYHILKQNLTI